MECSLCEVDDGIVETKHKSEKVAITVSAGHHYVDSVKNGAEFTSVDYSGRMYGGGSPCDTEEEVKSAIESAKETIRNKGDIPIVDDLRKKKDLSEWF